MGFWGSFGWYSLRFPGWLYWILGGVTLAAGVGLFYFVVRVIKGAIKIETSQTSVLLLYGLMFILALGLTGFRFLAANVAWAGFGQNANTLPQGRFLFPAILAMSVLFMLGIRELIPDRYRGVGTVAVVTSLILFDLIVLVAFIIPYYYGGTV